MPSNRDSQCVQQKLIESSITLHVSEIATIINIAVKCYSNKNIFLSKTYQYLVSFFSFQPSLILGWHEINNHNIQILFFFHYFKCFTLYFSLTSSTFVIFITYQSLISFFSFQSTLIENCYISQIVLLKINTIFICFISQIYPLQKNL